MGKIVYTLISIVLIMGLSTVAQADSLWNADSRAIVTNQRVFRVGDLLTIIISERTTASQKTSTDGSEQTTAMMGPGAGLLRDVFRHMQGSVQNSYQGDGQTARTGALSGRLTVTITDIDDNGNLTVEGRQKIRINSDNQELFVQGRIRPDDVRPDNSVISSYIADAYIEYKGKGGSGDFNKPGVITRILGWLF